MNLAELYRAFPTSSEAGRKARALLGQTHWFVLNSEFDPRTGEALPQPLSGFLAKVAQTSTSGIIRDRLWRIAEHSRAAVDRLFRALNESPRREQAVLPVFAVRELDANSFIKLSNRPGRNLREKLAGKPYLQAVRRFQSVNLPENRLLKAFVSRLGELLELRSECLGQGDELQTKIQSWLRSEEARSIGHWDNLPPNNTLLSHRDYRRIWDAWRWLQTLDEDLAQDGLASATRTDTMRNWNRYAKKWAGGQVFAEMPVLFEYETFAIRPWLAPDTWPKQPRRIWRSMACKESSLPVCIDLTDLRPRYAATSAPQSLPDAFLWQRWQNEEDVVALELFRADAACLHPDALSLSAADVLFAKDNTSEPFDRAARAFAARLRELFKHDTLLWLVPDFLSDFELEVTRRNLNARFPAAEPLPRSVAAVFEKVDYARVRDGTPIVVVDTVGGTTCVTKLLPRFDPELLRRLADTRGFYWERCPPVVYASSEPEGTEATSYDLITLGQDGQWHDAAGPLGPPALEPSILMRDPRIGPCDYFIKVTGSPVAGGFRFHSLRLGGHDLALWRDQIPELSMGAMMDGRYQRFSLVARGTTVKPVRGKPVLIPVKDLFTLPAGRAFYLFPLFQGENADELGFSARLDSFAFPLKGNVKCRLHLTFEYGADEPYKLVFAPLDQSFPPVHATWRRTQEVVSTDAPAPDYPAATWSDLGAWPRQNSHETTDLLKWVQDKMAGLDQDLYVRPLPRTLGVIAREWLTGANGKHFTFAECPDVEASIFIYEKGFLHGNHDDFTEGDSISFELQERAGKYSGWKVAGPDHVETAGLRALVGESCQVLVGKVGRQLYFPVIQVWSDGRSLGDQACPPTFAAHLRKDIDFLETLLGERGLPDPLKKQVLFLLSCMHKDAPEVCIHWIREQIEKDSMHDPRALGFALGDVSQPWQKDALARLLARPSRGALRIFAYAIWREAHFVDKFTAAELNAVLNSLLDLLGKDPVRGRPTVEMLELLLGLLRTRASSDSEIRMLLQPHQKITKALAKEIERVTAAVARSGVQLPSRVQINLQKPEGDRTPDLLYALRLYLTGDDGANAIHINSVADGDND